MQMYDGVRWTIFYLFIWLQRTCVNRTIHIQFLFVWLARFRKANSCGYLCFQIVLQRMYWIQLVSMGVQYKFAFQFAQTTKHTPHLSLQIYFAEEMIKRTVPV